MTLGSCLASLAARGPRAGSSVGGHPWLLLLACTHLGHVFCASIWFLRENVLML